MVEIPIYQKLNLTIEEAAAYSNIGTTTLRKRIKTDKTIMPAIIYVGNKVLLKRCEFEQWNQKQYILET